MNKIDEWSKFLSLLLRHQPDAVGLQLDAAGWVSVDQLVEKCREHGRQLTNDIVLEIVATSSKQRFALSDDGRRIRANQGHSIDVELDYEQCEPPSVLYHGTVAAHLESIRKSGLLRMERHHVHLSFDEATARIVGKRRGKPIILKIAAKQMHLDGYVFVRSTNGVWLTETVPAKYIAFPDGV